MQYCKNAFTRAVLRSFVQPFPFLEQKNAILKGLFVIGFCFSAQVSFSQITDSTKKLNHFGAALSVTNNGIAFVPAFSLGKPAIIFDLSAGRKLSFDPQFRFALDSKPWNFIFSWRYKLLSKTKVRVVVGVHPALNFRTVSVTANDVTTNLTIVRRYLSSDLAYNYFVAKTISVGAYYLYSRGIDRDAIRNTHLIGLNSNFSNIKLGGAFFLRFTPQAYYLLQSPYNGYYLSSTLSLVKKNFPFSLSSIANKAVHTDIPGSENFIWNLILTYSFSKFYVEK